MRLSPKVRSILAGALLAVTAAASVTAFVPSAAATTAVVTPGCANPKYFVSYGDTGAPSNTANPGLVKVSYSASPAGTTQNVTITANAGVVLCRTMFYDTNNSGGPYSVTFTSTNPTTASHTSATGKQAVEVSATDAVAPTTTATVPPTTTTVVPPTTTTTTVVPPTTTVPPACRQSTTASYDGTQVTISGVQCEAGNASTYTILNTKCDGNFGSGMCVPQAIFMNVPIPVGNYGVGAQYFLSAPACGFWQFDLYLGGVQSTVTQSGTARIVYGFIGKTRNCVTTTPPTTTTTTVPPTTTTTSVVPPTTTTTTTPPVTTTPVVPPTAKTTVPPVTTTTSVVPPTTTTSGVVAPPVVTTSTPPVATSHSYGGGGIPTGVDAGQAPIGSNRLEISLVIAAISLTAAMLLKRKSLSELLAPQRGNH